MDNNDQKPKSLYVPPANEAAFELELSKVSSMKNSITVLNAPRDPTLINAYKQMLVSGQNALIGAYSKQELSHTASKSTVLEDTLKNLVAALELFGFAPLGALTLEVGAENLKEDVLGILERRGFNPRLLNAVEILSTETSDPTKHTSLEVRNKCWESECSAFVLSLHCLQEAITFAEVPGEFYVELLNRKVRKN